MTFEYLQRVVLEGQLSVENIGECCLRAFNDLGEEFYLIINTILGWTDVLEYGPVIPDLNMLQMNYQITYNRFEYNQTKIERTIDKFLNNPKKAISQAEVVELSDIRHNLINPIDKIFPLLEGVCDE